jgi:hypothetical protein
MRTDLSTGVIAACIMGLCACGSSSDGTLFHSPSGASTGGSTVASVGGTTSTGGARADGAAGNSGGSPSAGGGSASGGASDDPGGTGGADASATGGATGTGGDATGGTLGASGGRSSGGRSSGGASDGRDASARDAGTSSLTAGGLVSQDCVDCMDKHCADELATCEAKSSCKSLEKCVSTCATIVCATCVASDPFDYSALFGGCANEKCSDVCPTSGT